MPVRIIQSHTRASNISGLDVVVAAQSGAAVQLETNRATQAENLLQGLINALTGRTTNLENTLQTDDEALIRYNELMALINSGDAIDRAGISALVATAIKSKVERNINVVDGVITLAQAPASGIDSIDRLIVNINGEDYDILPASVAGTALDTGDATMNGSVVFIKYDVMAVPA